MAGHRRCQGTSEGELHTLPFVLRRDIGLVDDLDTGEIVRSLVEAQLEKHVLRADRDEGDEGRSLRAR